MKKKPYVGITGFMFPDQVIAALENIDFKKADRLLMVGVLASSKTIQGLTNKWPHRYPEFERIKDIFQDHESCLNLIHYNTKEPETLTEQLLKVTDTAGPNLHGFQLNTAWPNPLSLQKYKDEHPEKVIVLQVGGSAFSMINHSAVMLEDMVQSYLGIADYVLLDPSGGLGQELNPFAMRDYLLAIAKHEKQIGLGVAGGLSSTTLHLIEPLVKDFPNLSIDAEGRLRTPEDSLDKLKVKDYLQKSLDMFSVSV